MKYFINDYSAGAHPRILDAFAKTNLDNTVGYANDEHCKNAEMLIKQRIKDMDADIHFMVGGTITNLTAISAFLKPYQAAISPHTGHICVHETGSVEATGHKVIHVKSDDGKIYPMQIEQVVLSHEDEHMVQPKLVYISNSTEIGTIYTKAELTELRKVCDKHGLYLYMDGARLGSALTASGNDLNMEDLPRLLDAFYIGGTKNACLFGEALVIVNPQLKPDFRFSIKQKGGMFAKGRLIGIQFEEMFKDNLYFDIAAETNAYAKKLSDGIRAKGYDFIVDSPSNQIFPIFPQTLVEKLEKEYNFYRWASVEDDKIAIRLVTAWTTTDEDVESFLASI